MTGYWHDLISFLMAFNCMPSFQSIIGIVTCN